jgi:pSer/pThr/pTyr-binding forkhead associated (FHA) protein
MNLNPISSDLTHILDEPHGMGAFSADLSADLSAGIPFSPVSTADQDLDDAVLSRSTLLINTPSATQPESFKTQTEPNLKYVQGVVQQRQAYLITNLSHGTSQTVFQPQMVWTLGRNRDAAIPLQDRVMSRRHAVILFVPEEGFQLIDLNSMNGTFINTTRIQQRQWLQDGDRIRVGSTDFTFFLSQDSRSADSLHPEVLARFNVSKFNAGEFIDYSALEDLKT